MDLEQTKRLIIEYLEANVWPWKQIAQLRKDYEAQKAENFILNEDLSKVIKYAASNSINITRYDTKGLGAPIQIAYATGPMSLSVSDTLPDQQMKIDYIVAKPIVYSRLYSFNELVNLSKIGRYHLIEEFKHNLEYEFAEISVDKIEDLINGRIND
jgi:hypothetical protein